MKKIFQTEIVFILAIVLSAVLTACGSTSSGRGSGSKHSKNSGSSGSTCLDYNDFNDNTLGPWIANGSYGYSVTVSGGEVHMTAPAVIPASDAYITKDLSLSGDFVVTIDEVQQAADGMQWWHELALKVDDNNAVNFIDGNSMQSSLPGWMISKLVNGVSTELFLGNPYGLAGIANTLTTMKIKRVGDDYTFSIIRDGVETVVTTQNIPDFSSFSQVMFKSWVHLDPVDIIADNFKAWSDTSAETCSP